MATVLNQIRCISCNKIIAEGNIQKGIIEIDCQHCGVTNKIEATHKDEKPVTDLPPYGERVRYSHKAS